MSYVGNQPISAAFLVDTFSGNGTTVAFTMTVAPANTSSIIVAITGVVQDPSTYSVSGTTLTFSAAPPSGTNNISVRYLGIPASGVTTTAYRTVTDSTATAGQTTFTIPSYTVGYVDVFRNGVRLAAADYTATTGTTVVLASGATVGDTITTVSFYVSSVLNAIPATAASVQQTYLASGVAGTGPSFSAYLASSGGSIATATFTKFSFDTELWDTNSNFASSRFTPTVAGYYQLNATVQLSAGFPGFATLYKNGSEYKRGPWVVAAAGYQECSVSGLVYCNGSTDYIELYVYQTSGSTLTPQGNGGGTISWFDGFLARAA